ncbi:MAG TPA: DinB family protein [Herpetosiphonaceae bacterium]
MTQPALRDRITADILAVLEETFERVQGIYLDRGTSLFETLAGITAETASRRIAPECSPLSAQVAHVILYLEVLEQAMHGKQPGKTDWGEIWRTVAEVTEEEWAASVAKLRATYERIKGDIAAGIDWEREDAIGAAMALAIHTAYHLGEIRQGLGVLRGAGAATS